MNDHFGIGAFLVVLIIIIQSIIGSYFSQKNFRYFHEIGIAIVLGMIVSAFAYYALDYQVKLEKKMFIYVFLPAIVFAEGYSLKKKIFFHNMTYILIYGFLGTIITFIFLVVSINYLSNNDLITIERRNRDILNGPLAGTDLYLNTKEIILFSAALSSKDSFLASTMVSHHAFPTLFHVIFGEGIMNDATSLILFDSFETLIEDESNFNWKTIPSVFKVFIISLSLSVVSGMFFGILGTLLLKYLRFLNQTVIHEILIIFMCSYSGYCIIEYFNLSGIISLLVSGFIIGYYGFHNLSDKAKICANVTFQTISCGAENFLFAFVGFTTFSFYRNAWSFSLIGWIVLILIVSRIFQVFVMSAIFSLFYRKKPFLMKFREQVVICFTGISRGILGFILMEEIESEGFQDLLNSTMIGVLITTTLLFGLINPKLIDCVLPPPKHNDHENESQASNKHENENKNPKQNHKDIENQNVTQVRTQNKAQTEIISPQKFENVQIRKIQTQQINKNTESSENNQQTEENLSDKDYFVVKKQKIEALLVDVYDEKLFGSKIQFKFSRFNEKYLKPFLVRDYQSKLDEFIIANRMLREDRIQLTRPLGQNKNSQFITKSLQKIKTVLQLAQSQKLVQVENIKKSQILQDQEPQKMNLNNQEQPQPTQETMKLKPHQTEQKNNVDIEQINFQNQNLKRKSESINLQQEIQNKQSKD
ncbi:transporter/monovalent cation:proton antiporter-1 (CPA1) family protein (macronuclear) [Tetrahymena thermophila SB210]|uniref:Transporter/monovalent cation:proton antiporter-1 (CPA1) family protein n=1 Tax=Tetrahymena thermophila (strain SB210) TaxID=312017 RepID=Q24DB7_TETTS|nr:transporter/monovalent cation:proton antiporter-1 (CPA1) family protein [Tetrahymena thermophila SB210]EAS05788.2 transporter/monovalent cation:proton antiporter-1 (CPA1) family protein [Tetrahymena thermophila SB210]|eukprot:XP_001026033.2 transporter/monovalent cation:proton antiporter-1 (CPA1) family protein [Tetrahymena thermophila SB210]